MNLGFGTNLVKAVSCKQTVKSSSHTVSLPFEFRSVALDLMCSFCVRLSESTFFLCLLLNAKVSPLSNQEKKRV